MPKGSAKKVSDHRDRLRAQGLRPVQFWVSDTRNPAVAGRIRREVRGLRDAASEAEIESLLDAALADVEGRTA